MRGERLGKVFGMFLLVLVLSVHFALAAGVGLKWSQESTLVPENTKACMTYYVYNPWTTDTYVQMKLSNDLQSIVSSYESEKKLVPAGTSSSDAIPLEFCFKIPSVYEKDCWIGNSLFCKEECTQDMKVYSGQVIAAELSEQQFNGGGSGGGSATQMSISAPIKVGVQCIAHGRNMSPLYILIILVAGVLLAIYLVRKKKGFVKKNNSSGIKSKKKK